MDKTPPALWNIAIVLGLVAGFAALGLVWMIYSRSGALDAGPLAIAAFLIVFPFIGKALAKAGKW